MRNRLTLFIFSVLLLSLNANARVNKKPFRISINADTEYIKGFQKRAELKMARSTAFCRGFYMPKSLGIWRCKSSGPKTKRCKRQYQCHVTTISFNRVTETRRLRSELRKTKVNKSKLKIRVSRKPYKKKYLKKRRIIKKKKIVKITAPKKVVAIENDLEELDDDLNEELEGLKEEVVSEEKQRTPESFADNSREQENASSSSASRPIHFAAFSLEIIQVADEFGSLATLGASWTPRKSFNSNFGIRGQFGFKSIKTFIETEFEEIFLVYEFGLFLDFNLNKNFYVEAGYVFQKWSNTASDSVTALNFGGGYIFDEKMLNIFDRVFINYATVSNDTSNSELKLAAGISF